MEEEILVGMISPEVDDASVPAPEKPPRVIDRFDQIALKPEDTSASLLTVADAHRALVAVGSVDPLAASWFSVPLEPLRSLPTEPAAMATDPGSSETASLWMPLLIPCDWFRPQQKTVHPRLRKRRQSHSTNSNSQRSLVSGQQSIRPSRKSSDR